MDGHTSAGAAARSHWRRWPSSASLWPGQRGTKRNPCKARPPSRAPVWHRCSCSCSKPSTCWRCWLAGYPPRPCWHSSRCKSCTRHHPGRRCCPRSWCADAPTSRPAKPAARRPRRTRGHAGAALSAAAAQRQPGQPGADHWRPVWHGRGGVGAGGQLAQPLFNPPSRRRKTPPRPPCKLLQRSTRVWCCRRCARCRRLARHGAVRSSNRVLDEAAHAAHAGAHTVCSSDRLGAASWRNCCWPSSRPRKPRCSKQ